MFGKITAQSFVSVQSEYKLLEINGGTSSWQRQ